MQDYVIWFAAACTLVAAELFTGTFYLLMVAIGFGAAGLTAFLGGGLPLQLVIGAAIGIAATVILRRTRWGKLQKQGDALHNPDVILDIGQTVHVTEWNDGVTRVQYRGASWEAVMENGSEPATGNLIIKAVRGSTLVLVAA